MLNTTLCYITRGDVVLLLHRLKKKNDVNQDKWIGVGGKFEEGESPEDCLCREVWEETGLKLQSWRYCGIVTFTCEGWEGEYMHLFTSDDFTGELKVCEEGDLQWVSREFLDALPKWEGDTIFLKLMWENAPFFSLKLCYQKDKLLHAALNGRPLPVQGC